MIYKLPSNIKAYSSGLKKITFLTIFILTIHLLYSQQPYFKNLSLQDGLPSSNVYYAFQDSKGYMWFATDAGVSFYDGYDFKNYTTDDGLSDNEVFQIHEDTKGRLWFLTLNGEVSFFYQDHFYNSKNDSTLKKASMNSFLLSFLEDKNGNIFIGSANGEIVKISQTHVEKFFIEGWHHFLWNKDSKIQSLHTTGVIQISKDFKKAQNLFNIELSMINKGIDFNNQIFFGTGQSLCAINTENTIDTLFQFKIPKKSITSIYRQPNGRFWIGSRNGIFMQDLESLELTFSNFLKGSTISSTLEDREGNIWITTLNNGVYFISSMNTSSYKGSILGEYKIYVLSKDYENNLWIGGEKNRCFKLLQDSIIDKSPTTLKNNYSVTGIRNFKPNQTWITTKRNILYHKNNKKLYFPYFGNDLLIDENENLWIAAKQLIKIPKEEWQKRLSTNSKSKTISNADPIISKNTILKIRPNSIIEDNNGTIWVGTDKGLFVNYNNQIKPFLDFPSEISGKITALDYSSSEDLLIVASQLNGIAIIQDGKMIKQISKADGLLTNICKTVKRDISSKSLWVATDKGLLQIKYNNNSIKIPSHVQYKNLQINDIEIIKHKIYLATNKGLLSIDSKKEKPNKIKPLVYINSFTVNNKITNYNKGHIELTHDKNDISISFIGLFFKNTGKIKYKYKLNNDVWKETTARNLTFESLTPNNYLFKVKSVNDKGVESDNSAIINFSISPPFWQKWWFRASIGLIILSSIFLIWKIRMRSINKKFSIEKEKLELEKHLAEMEQKSLRLQMNPHFIFNVINSVKGDYAENNVRRANKYLVKFSKFLRLVLENTEPIISLEAEIVMLTLYMDLTLIRYENKFNYKFILNDDLSRYETGIPSMLLQPFVENSIIHGIVQKKEKGSITIQFTKYQEGMLMCKIEDNGIGRPAASVKKEEIHNSQAIKITQERLNLITQQTGVKCKLNIIDKTNKKLEATGTCIEIIIPILNLNYD